MGCLDILSSVAGCFTLPLFKAGQLNPYVVFSATFEYIFVFPHTSEGIISCPMFFHLMAWSVSIISSPQQGGYYKTLCTYKVKKMKPLFGALF